MSFMKPERFEPERHSISKRLDVMESAVTALRKALEDRERIVAALVARARKAAAESSWICPQCKSTYSEQQAATNHAECLQKGCDTFLVRTAPKDDEDMSDHMPDSERRARGIRGRGDGPTVEDDEDEEQVDEGAPGAWPSGVRRPRKRETPYAGRLDGRRIYPSKRKAPRIL